MAKSEAMLPDLARILNGVSWRPRIPANAASLALVRGIWELQS